jgi:uncharacterized protein
MTEEKDPDLETQADVLAFLCDPASYGGVKPTEIVTHLSRIFLAGDRALKLKRAVKLPFVDFSELDTRLRTCRREVTLNRRTAPMLYLGVREITRSEDGVIGFDGEGQLVDAVVEMARFDQECLFDRLALEGRLSTSVIDVLAGQIASFHNDAKVVPDHGGLAPMLQVVEKNGASFEASGLFDPKAVSDLQAALSERLTSLGPLLDRRAETGFVRRCHGDMHLGNIALIDGQPVLFDCIEFSEQLASIDVVYDLAFLVMDLWFQGQAGFANRLANRYFDQVEDEEGYLLLPVFMAMRAAIRAHVTATAAKQAGEDRERQQSVAKAYFQFSNDLLAQQTSKLVAIGGLSGSGKTTIAEALAPKLGNPPGSRVFESDRLRKSLFGCGPEDRLPAEAYRPEFNERVYSILFRKSVDLASLGVPVVANAVFAREAERTSIAADAAQRHIPFSGIWLHTDAEALRRRVAARKGGPSDATVDVLDRQLKIDTGEIDWYKVDVSGSVDAIVEEILDRLGETDQGS